MGAFSVWAGGNDQAAAIDAEATGDRAEKADAETNRLPGGMPSRGERIKTMEAQERIRRYSAGERDFAGATLSGADLEWADLKGANLSKANLAGANVTAEQLGKAASLRGATMPDGTQHDEAAGAGW